MNSHNALQSLTISHNLILIFGENMENGFCFHCWCSVCSIPSSKTSRFAMFFWSISSQWICHLYWKLSLSYAVVFNRENMHWFRIYCQDWVNLVQGETKHPQTPTKWMLDHLVKAISSPPFSGSPVCPLVLSRLFSLPFSPVTDHVIRASKTQSTIISLKVILKYQPIYQT